jgi:hypothetical protein
MEDQMRSIRDRKGVKNVIHLLREMITMTTIRRKAELAADVAVPPPGRQLPRQKPLSSSRPPKATRLARQREVCREDIAPESRNAVPPSIKK